jgi:hypothetical protein
VCTHVASEQTTRTTNGVLTTYGLAAVALVVRRNVVADA